MFVLKMKQKLYLCNDGIAAESVDLIANTLLDGGCPPLRTFHFYNNMSGNVGAVALARIVEGSEVSNVLFKVITYFSLGELSLYLCFCFIYVQKMNACSITRAHRL